MRSLLLAYLLEHPVGDGVAGRAAVDLVDVSLFSRFTSCKQPVDGSDTCLNAQPSPDPDAGLIGDNQSELAHSSLQPLAVTVLDLRDPPYELGLTIGQPLRDQRVHLGSKHLPPPYSEQPRADIAVVLCRIGHRTVGAITGRRHRWWPETDAQMGERSSHGSHDSGRGDPDHSKDMTMVHPGTREPYQSQLDKGSRMTTTAHPNASVPANLVPLDRSPISRPTIYRTPAARARISVA